VEQSMPEINILLRATDEASNVIAKASGNIERSMQNVEASSKQVTRAQQTHEISTRQLALGMNGLATSAFSLYDAVDRVQDMQVSVDRANLQVKSSLNSLDDAQRRYNAAVEKYGENSEQAKAAEDDLEVAQERHNVAIERAEMLQGNYNETIARSALQIIPTAITMVDSFGKVWSNIPDLSGALRKLSSGIGDVGMSAKTAAIGVAGFVGGFMAGDAILKAVPENMRGIASALMAGIAAIVAATVAWMALQGTMTVGIAVPIILAAVGVGIAGVKGLMGLAEGGIVTRPTIALIGEAGTEAVIPLNRIATTSNLETQNITVNPTINIGNISSELDLPKVTDAVSRGIAEALRRRL
jgi:hypothetical protein